MALLAKQNAAIDKTMNMAFNVGLTAGSFETAAALTLSIGRIRAFSILAGEKELPPDLNSIVNNLENKLAHFRALADQALKGEVVEFKFTSQVVGMYKTLTDNWPSTGSTFYGERNLKDGEGD